MKTESRTSVLLELLDNKMLKNSMEKIIEIDAPGKATIKDYSLPTAPRGRKRNRK